MDNIYSLIVTNKNSSSHVELYVVSSTVSNACIHYEMLKESEQARVIDNQQKELLPANIIKSCSLQHQCYVDRKLNEKELKCQVQTKN